MKNLRTWSSSGQNHQSLRSPVCVDLALVVPRVNYVLRVVNPALSFRFAQMHDAGTRECFQALLRLPITQHMWEMASLPSALGLSTAHWASRSPGSAHVLTLLTKCCHSPEVLVGATGVDVLEWCDVDRGQRPRFHPDDEFPRISRIGSVAKVGTHLTSPCPFTARANGWDSLPRAAGGASQLDSRGHRDIRGARTVSDEELCRAHLQRGWNDRAPMEPHGDSGPPETELFSTKHATMERRNPEMIGEHGRARLGSSLLASRQMAPRPCQRGVHKKAPRGEGVHQGEGGVHQRVGKWDGCPPKVSPAQVGGRDVEGSSGRKGVTERWEGEEEGSKRMREVSEKGEGEVSVVSV